MKFVPKPLHKTADVSRGDRSWQSFLKNALGVVIVLGLIYLGLGLLADLFAYSIPERWEAKLFTWGPGGSSGGSERFLQAEEVFQRLLDAAELRSLPYRLFEIHKDVPNAVAVPGGGVGITTGLLDSVRSDVGLATVLGHELGHQQGRHCLKGLGRSILYEAAMMVLFGESGNSVMDVSLQLGESSYSRSQEREADEFGLRLVHEVFGHTEGSLEFFEYVKQEYDEGRPQWGAFMATHPLTEERIAYLKDLQADLAGSSPE